MRVFKFQQTIQVIWTSVTSAKNNEQFFLLLLLLLLLYFFVFWVGNSLNDND